MLRPVKDLRDLTILEHLRETKAATVSDLAAATGSSIATIRRDLQRLDEAGLVRRTHGGAVLTDQGEGDAPFPSVVSVNLAAKLRIARAAAEGLHDGQTVILDIGTTTLQLARLLRGRGLTVITSNIAVFDLLRDDPETHIVVLPGDFDPVYQCVHGHLTTESLRLVRADHAFLGVSGVSAAGDLRDTTIAQVPIKQAMAEASDAVTVLADASKFPGTGTGRIALPPSLTRVITDAEPPVTASAAFAARSVEVVVV